MRKKAVGESSPASAAEGESRSGSHQSWAMLIKRVYEVDPLSCPQCGGQMAVVAFIKPPQTEVIEKILRGHQSGADQRRPKLRLCARRRLVALIGSQSSAGQDGLARYGWLPPFGRRASRTDLRGHRHVSGDLPKSAGARCPEDGARVP